MKVISYIFEETFHVTSCFHTFQVLLDGTNITGYFTKKVEIIHDPEPPEGLQPRGYNVTMTMENFTAEYNHKGALLECYATVDWCGTQSGFKEKSTIATIVLDKCKD